MWYVLNGNFTAQHMKMKKPEDDVALSDSLGYMVTEASYSAHMATATEHQEVSDQLSLHFFEP